MSKGADRLVVRAVERRLESKLTEHGLRELDSFVRELVKREAARRTVYERATAASRSASSPSSSWREEPAA